MAKESGERLYLKLSQEISVVPLVWLDLIGEELLLRALKWRDASKG